MSHSSIYLSLLLLMPCASWALGISDPESDPADSPSRLPRQSTLLGHNLTPTSYTLKKGDVTVGTYALAYGITDHLMIGTSTWLDYSYNMPNLDMRYSFWISDFIQNASFESLIFKTFAYGNNFYQQESIFERFTATHRFGAAYSLHLSCGFQYFFDDISPFSLRLDPLDGSHYNINASTLSEIHFFENLGIFVELGTIGLNYATPYLHTGISLFGQWKWGLIQIGISRSRSASSKSETIYRLRNYTYYDTVWHPEVQLQVQL